MAYVDRLKCLSLNSLELRRLHSDLTEMFKIVKDFSSPLLKSALRFFTVTCTRGHRFKLFMPFIKTNICRHFLFFVL